MKLSRSNHRMSAERIRWVVGCMTGTSLDGLDGALMEIRGSGLCITARFKGLISCPLGDLREPLLEMSRGRDTTPSRIMRTARQLGDLHAATVTDLCAAHLPAGATLDFVVAHGQTIRHEPGDPKAASIAAGRLSWQLLDPWPIVRRLGVPVLHDLRQADLIAGGQGAPITPLSDWVMYRRPDTHRFVINLGGICNYTELPAGCTPQQVQGGDYGPCNLLIDGLVQACFPEMRYDRDGRIAAGGRRNDFVDRTLRTHESFLLAVEKFDRPKVTLGREDITDDFIELLVRRAEGSLAPDDLIASAVDWVAQRVAACASGPQGPVEIVIAGGGANNPHLVDRIRACLKPDDRLVPSDELGVPNQGREPAAMAVLGALCQDRIVITLPRITGADRPGTAGLWAYP